MDGRCRRGGGVAIKSVYKKDGWMVDAAVANFLLTYKDAKFKIMVKNKGMQQEFGTLTRQQRVCLLRPVKSVDVKYANREQVVEYLCLLEKKILAIRECTRLGKDFENLKLNFNTEFVYIVLSDLFITLTDYLKIKDMLLYQDYSAELSKE